MIIHIYFCFYYLMDLKQMAVNIVFDQRYCLCDRYLLFSGCVIFFSCLIRLQIVQIYKHRILFPSERHKHFFPMTILARQIKMHALVAWNHRGMKKNTREGEKSTKYQAWRYLGRVRLRPTRARTHSFPSYSVHSLGVFSYSLLLGVIIRVVFNALYLLFNVHVS